ncbi:uncharacterized protein LOC118344672 [Juglans regia]|uniref:Uncharacterized protein LOC118344672 n=1 Tax=Juglans regia TaxID=51240 RepID=A0A6P9EBE7_JUGRE|nr:uncharacterized protein LOC118344672 [Juglans regia]
MVGSAQTRYNFPPQTVVAIAKLGLSVEVHEDKLIWGETQDGRYSIKSAYSFNGKQAHVLRGGESSLDSGHKVVWQGIWKLQVPQRIKVFTWRACKESPHSRHNLKSRKSSLAGGFGSVGKEKKFQGNGPSDMYKWQDRRLGVFCDVGMKLLARQESIRQHKTEVKHTMGWSKPPQGVLKLNVDGAIFANPHVAGVGVILRDSEGTVLLAASMKESEVGDPAKIDMVAMLRGLRLCIPMGIEKLILESDSLLMVNQMNGDTKPWSLFRNIIKETRQCSTRFRSCIVQHVGRLGSCMGGMFKM